MVGVGEVGEVEVEVEVEVEMCVCVCVCVCVRSIERFQYSQIWHAGNMNKSVYHNHLILTQEYYARWTIDSGSQDIQLNKLFMFYDPLIPTARYVHNLT